LPEPRDFSLILGGRVASLVLTLILLGKLLDRFLKIVF